MTPLLHLDQRDPYTPRHVLPALVEEYDPVVVGPDGAYHQPDHDRPGRTVCRQPVHGQGWHCRAAWRAAEITGGLYCATCYPPILPWAA